MRKWSLLALAVVLAGALGGYFGFGRTADVQAQDCDDYVSQTNERVNAARELLYPAGRLNAFEGSAEEAAQELANILADQENAEPPEGGGNLHDDLIEAMNAGVEGLIQSGNADPFTQIAFAKSIIYNADARLVTLINTC
jgi:hypothetical protein